MGPGRAAPSGPVGGPVGLTGKALDRWLRGIDSVQRDLENPEGMSAEEVLLGLAITPAAEQAAWWSCLDQAPTPEAMGELLGSGRRPRAHRQHAPSSPLLTPASRESAGRR